MPKANPLPRKYLSIIRDIQEELRLIALKSRQALYEVEAGRTPYRLTRTTLQEIEVATYRLALELNDIRVECTRGRAAEDVETVELRDRLATLLSQLEPIVDELAADEYSESRINPSSNRSNVASFQSVR